MECTEHIHSHSFLDERLQWNLHHAGCGVIAKLPPRLADVDERPRVHCTASGQLYLESNGSSYWLSEFLSDVLVRDGDGYFIITKEATCELQRNCVSMPSMPSPIH